MRIRSRHSLTLAAAATLLLALSFGVSADTSLFDGSLPSSKQRKTRDSFLETPKATPFDHSVQAAVDKGLKHLVSLQDPETGAWKGDVGLKYGVGRGAYTRDARKQPHLGITALACMALVANGTTPTSGPYSLALVKGTKFILDNVKEGGQVVAYGTRMYSNAFAVLYLAEIYGMFGGEEIAKKLRDAISFIERNQVGDGTNKGGWRYVPKQNDADVSVTVSLLQALRAARNVGIKVHQETIDMAREYIVRTYDGGDGSFVYQPSQGFGRDSFALTSAGLVALQSAGNYTSFALDGITIRFERSYRYLESKRPDQHERMLSTRSCDFAFWYGHYYAAQAMRQRAISDPEAWEAWNNKNRRHFLKLQDPATGAWLDEIGNWQPDEAAYGTAMACLILGIPNNYLPIFQH
ncbi:MAG: terpene cyclase/mutase family protein [Planctomycetes bacterium]|nr:terpene cyclase/mutase family protein [Planctomycetota bacterium]